MKFNVPTVNVKYFIHDFFAEIEEYIKNIIDGKDYFKHLNTNWTVDNTREGYSTRNFTVCVYHYLTTVYVYQYLTLR